MSDFLLENEAARRLIKTLGLPVPVPPRLRRTKEPWEERPLQGATATIGSADGGALANVLARTLAFAGAEPQVVGSSLLAAFAEPGEAYGRPAHSIDVSAVPEGLTTDALVFDATGVRTPEQLRAVYDFFHPLIGRLRSSGRAVVLGRPPAALDTPIASASMAALEGFVRSLAKEIGRRGSTAQLVWVDSGAEDRVEAVLRFLLSRRSAFITGQPIHVSAEVRAPASIPWVRPLDGKVALVTGAARGIGEATASLLAAEGAHVICLDRPQDDALVSQVARKLDGSVLLADIGDPTAANAIADGVRQQHGRVDVVVHNAGITRDKTLAKMSGELWDQTLAVNLAAVDRITRALLDGLLRDDGRIVCLSSIAGLAGNMGQTNYAASKAGIVGYVRKLSRQLAGKGITVNAIAPGFIETRLTAAIPVVIREVARRLSSLGQGGLPQDIGEAVTFLASPGAVGINGQVLRVCGGAFVGA